MTSKNILWSLGGLDPELIMKAAPAEKVQSASQKGMRQKKKNAWIKWVSTAACFVLLASASVWLIAPDQGAYEQVAITTLIRLDERYCASYIRVNQMSNYERLTLEGKIGELYLETETQKLYKVKGHDDIAQLIAVSADGEVHLFRFEALIYDNNDQTEPFSLGIILKTIYCVTSADDVKIVKFEKVHKNNREIKVQSVLVDDRADLAHFFDQVCALEGEEYQPSKYLYVHQHSEEYLNGTLPLSVQVERKVTVKFKNNTSIELVLDPLNNHLCLENMIIFEMPEQEMDWLIGLAKINMQHVDYGIADEEIRGGEGAETASRPAAP